MRTRFLFIVLFSLLTVGCGEDTMILTSPTLKPLAGSGEPVATGPQLPIDALAEALYLNLKKVEDRAEEVRDEVGEEEDVLAKTIMIATFVDSNNLDKTNRLGRLVSEELIARMFSYGFKIVEFRATRTLLLKKNQGDFALSREVEKLRDSYGAEYMIVGTYTDAADSVFLNARLIDLETAHILSATSHEIIKSNEIVYLMEDGKKKTRNIETLKPSSYER